MRQRGEWNLKRKAVFGTLLAFLLIGIFVSASHIRPVKASGTIIIRADGSVDPPTAPISTVDNVTYTFTNNIIDSIVMERDNIILDGAGYTLQPNEMGIYFYSRSNITIRNTNIVTASNYYGIWGEWSECVNIHGNNITNYFHGISLSYCSNNRIYGNKINGNNTTDDIGIEAWDICYNTTVYSNSITGNSYGVWGYEKTTVFDNNITDNYCGVRLRGQPHHVYRNNIIKNGEGIWLESSQQANIEGNNIRNNTYNGIRLTDSHYNLITGNNITTNNLCGIDLIQSLNNSISGNNITANGYGIKFFPSSHNNTISGNNIGNNSDGIGFFVSSFNTICENNVTANTANGLYLIESLNNTIYHNNFVDNAKQVYLDYSWNVWDDGYPSGGNYWDDYTGSDADGDGIGDTPYIIDVDNRDRYPLVHPYGSVRNLNTGLTYLTVQSAINAPETLDGHTIFVNAGTYYEHIALNKSLSLVGEDRSNTIIDGNRTGKVVTITRNNVNITGFTVRYGAGYPNAGIQLKDANYCNISGNNIIDNVFGIELYISSNYNTISRNNITANIYYGIVLGYLSYYNNVSGNYIARNGDGILLGYSSYNTICGNHITANNNDGIYMDSSSFNTICENNITANHRPGIWLVSSSNNSIYHNNFANSIQVSTYKSVNEWDDSYPSGGNYWSDYIGADYYRGPYQNMSGSDNIGDTPYIVDANNTDRYPLMTLWSPHDVAVLNVTLSKTVVCQGFTMFINVTVENQGKYSESFNITLYAFTMPPAFEIGKLTVNNLAPETSETLEFTWNTEGFGKGHFTISAVSDTVPGETDSADNTCTDGNVVVAMIGDITGPDGWPDGKVDIRDIALVAKYFGQNAPPAPANCDITGPTTGVPDGKIDIRDIATVAIRFGQVDP